MSITDVAEAAGVSQATVSRVINNRKGVAEDTTRLVRETMKRLGYEPSDTRPGPKPGRPRGLRTHTVGFLALNTGLEILECPPVAMMFHGLADALRERGLHVLLDAAPDLQQLPSTVRKREVDGLLVMVCSKHMDLGPLVGQIPFVRVLGGGLGAEAYDQVGPDNIAAGRMAADYLSERGCKHLAFINYEPSHVALLEREAAFLREAARLNLPAQSWAWDPEAFELSKQDQPGGSPNPVTWPVEQLAAASPRPDGLFMPTDGFAANVYPMLAARGIQPGRDITVVSCNNEHSVLAALWPRPATIDLGFEDIGRRAVSRLLARIRHPDARPERVLVAPQLVPPGQNGVAENIVAANGEQYVV